MNLCDTHAFLGRWPFLDVPERTGPQLARHLAAHGITSALVSHLAAAFLPEPMLANRMLFAALRSTPALHPIPVIRPNLANWREQLDECSHLGDIRAIRLLPSYHDYRPDDRCLRPLLDEARRRRLHVCLTVRLDDERNRYHRLDVRGTPVAGIAKLLRREPGLHVLCNGLYKPEIELLAGQVQNFTADVTFAEFLDTLAALRSVLPSGRIVLGTGTPLLSTASQVAKVTCSRQPLRDRRLAGSANARRFARPAP